MRALHRIGARQTGELAAVCDERDGIHAGHVAVTLRHVAKTCANLEGACGNVEAEHAQMALRRRNEAEQALEHRALAGAVRAEEADGAFGKRGADVAQNGLRAVHDGHVIQLDDGAHAG